MTPILSICIPTVVGRDREVQYLTSRIDTQIKETGNTGKVEMLIIKDNKEMSIGEKRNQLYDRAKGEYSVQIDDDDDVADNFVFNVLKAARRPVDCIGYQEWITGMGRPCRSDFSLRYREWSEAGRTGLISGMFKYVRTPFHKVPIRTEIARSVRFADMRFGEDHDWSKRIYPLLKTENYVNQVMYYYRYTYVDPKVKYGIK